jgi:hypothetical protein
MNDWNEKMIVVHRELMIEGYIGAVHSKKVSDEFIA